MSAHYKGKASAAEYTIVERWRDRRAAARKAAKAETERARYDALRRVLGPTRAAAKIEEWQRPVSWGRPSIARARKS